MADDRARILARVREALAPLHERKPMPEYPDELPVAARILDHKETEQLFGEQLAKVSGRVFTDPAALAQWLADRGDTHGYCDPALIAELGPAFGAPFTLETKFARTRIDDYRFGITRASGAIAETGSVILDDETTSARLGALAPWIHVAVVRRKTIVRRLADAIHSLGTQANVVWCTGPSKTADVEGILIEGVHGPGEQIALVLD